jgi:ubiquinone/menaquinone biosynthesis C-methylase UbiE
MKHWYTKQPKKTRGFTALTKTYDDKYGDYDYAGDSRAADRTFKKQLLSAVGNIAGKYALVCGSNSGNEIETLKKAYPTARFVGVDISLKALAKLPPDISKVHANMENLPFKKDTFDVYINCRSIQSSNVNLVYALSEARRVTKGRIVITIPNGYLVDGKIVNGMYDYERKVIDPNKPAEFAKKLKSKLGSAKEFRSEAELFVVSN